MRPNGPRCPPAGPPMPAALLRHRPPVQGPRRAAARPGPDTPAHVTLTVAGEFWGGTEPTKKLITDLGLAKRVTLRPGYLPAREIPALFAAADALVLPYREATASQNVLLAFALGVPVITTTAGALAEAVRDGVDGLTCAPGDAADLARALNEFAEPETAERLRAGVRAVDPEPYWAAYLRVAAGRVAPRRPGRRPARRPPRPGRPRSSPPGRPARRPARTPRDDRGQHGDQRQISRGPMPPGTKMIRKPTAQASA